MRHRRRKAFFPPIFRSNEPDPTDRSCSREEGTRRRKRERENPCYARSKDIATEISLRWKERWNRTALLETRLKINLVLRKQGSSIERFKKGKGKQTERCVKSRCNDDFFEKPFLATHVHSPLTHSRVAKNNVE